MGATQPGPGGAQRVILAASAVLPSAREEPLLDGAVLLDECRIAAVGARGAMVRSHPLAAIIELPGSVLLPGFVDAHSHLRGVPTCDHGIEDAPLERWILRLHAMAALDPVADGLLAATGSLTTGITTTQVLYHTFAGAEVFREGARTAIEVLLQTGLHAELIVGLTDQAEFVPEEIAAEVDASQLRWLVPDRGIEVGAFEAVVRGIDRDLEDLVARHGGGSSDGPQVGSSWVRTGVAPVGPQWASDDLLALVAELAGPGRRIHTHALETRAQRHWVTDGPIERLERHGLVAPSTSLAHGIHLTTDEVARLAQQRVAIASCPTSNQRLADGIGDVVGWRNAGVPVGLGLDSNTSSHPPDVFEELRALQRAASRLGRELDARSALEVATTEGAVAVGRSDEIGTLATGRRADLVAVRLPSVGADSRRDDLVECLIERASRSDVVGVWTHGRRVVDHGKHVDHDRVVAAGESIRRELAATAEERATVREELVRLEPLVERIRAQRSAPPDR